MLKKWALAFVQNGAACPNNGRQLHGRPINRRNSFGRRNGYPFRNSPTGNGRLYRWRLSEKSKAVDLPADTVTLADLDRSFFGLVYHVLAV